MAKSAPATNAVPQQFEEALAELETIVATMEQGNLPLEASLTAYQRGITLLKFCQDKLTAADQSIRMLEGDVLRPLDSAESDI